MLTVMDSIIQSVTGHVQYISLLLMTEVMKLYNDNEQSILYNNDVGG